MRRYDPEVAATFRGPASEHTLGGLVVATLLWIGGLFAVLVAASYPAMAAGLLAAALVGVLVGGFLGRRRYGRRRRICLPGTDVCVEA